MNIVGGAGCEEDSDTREVLGIGPAASRNAIENGGVAGEAAPEAVRHRVDTEVEDLAAVSADLGGEHVLVAVDAAQRLPSTVSAAVRP